MSAARRLVPHCVGFVPAPPGWRAFYDGGSIAVAGWLLYADPGTPEIVPWSAVVEPESAKLVPAVDLVVSGQARGNLIGVLGPGDHPDWHPDDWRASGS